MRLHDFKSVHFRRVSPTEAARVDIPVIVDLDAICAIAPTTVPSELQGPGNVPIGTPACEISLPSGSVTVTDDLPTVKKLWQGELPVKIE